MTRTPTPARRRGPWLPLVALAVALTAGAVWWLSRPPAFSLEPDPEQNVLLITLDTFRADAMSAYGGPARTPHLDALAAGGVRFTFAHAHSVVTLPSHTSLFTGQYPYEHGIRDNSGFRVKAGTVTLATRLKAAGFSTGAFVGGFPLTKRFRLTGSFDEYDDQMPEMTGAIAISMPERPAPQVVERAQAWIRKQPGKFFGWIHLFDAHSPCQPPSDLAAAYRDQPYFGEAAAIDRALGPLFADLARLPRQTLVVVTADHGESLGEHGELTHGMFAYEPTLRVPLIVAQVGGGRTIRSGMVSDIPARLVDLAPTIMDAVGRPADDGMSGTSLLPALREGTAEDRPAYFEAMTYNLVRGWAPLRGVLSGRTKYIDLPIPELYDLSADPREASSRAGDRAVLAPMQTLLRGFNVAPPHRPGQESAEASAVLRSLGYVSGSAAPRATYTEADDPKRLVDVDRDLHRATEAFQQGRTNDGAALLERVITLRPDTADAYISLAHARWEAGDPRAAVEVLERGLRNGAPERDLRIRLGLYLSQSGLDGQKAVQLLQGLPSEDVEALTGLGVAYADAGRLADARGAFRRILALDPTNGLALQNLASLDLREALAQGATGADKLQSAEALVRQALDADPALAEAHTTLGVVLSTTGRKPQAIESWKRAVQLDAGQMNALYNLWFELAAAGRHQEAEGYGRQFVQRAPPAFFAPDIARVQGYLRGR